MERIVTIELFGETYKLKAGDDVGDVGEVTEFLAREVGKVNSDPKKAKDNITKFSMLLVASLNVSKEYMDMKKKYASLAQKVSRRSSEIIASMDDYISVDE